MGVTNTNKEVSVSSIRFSESFKVRLSIVAEPDIVNNPTDIVLILDRSGSMAGDPLANLKAGANKFIDIIDESTDGNQDGQIGNGSHIGIVSFATNATQDTQLITSVADLKAAINDIAAGGNTNHEDAFTKALDLFDPNSTNAKVMVMFTDGITTAGGNANTIATLAKQQGVIIYVIGLAGQSGIDEDALRDWASDPDSAYVVITPDDAELEDLFENLARNISNPGATNIVITDEIADCFRITALSAPSKGTAELINSTTVQWSIDELGVTQSEAATLEFTVLHEGDCTGIVEVNENITYTDDENNIITFPSPTIEIGCGNIITEPCPTPIDITIDGCTDSVIFDAGDIELTSLGRILQLDVTLRGICPNKRVALAILLNELDDEDNEAVIGMKTLIIPAQTGTSCQDILIRCIKFVLPDTLPMCNERNIRARFIANYMDFDFECCNLIL
ncbi:MAG: VWA domain-containing protein [Acholeplasmatales bacterium]|nr:VWA domain-containing protein [Acholeplasmatales bacterium]